MTCITCHRYIIPCVSRWLWTVVLVFRSRMFDDHSEEGNLVSLDIYVNIVYVYIYIYIYVNVNANNKYDKSITKSIYIYIYIYIYDMI